MMWMNPQEIQVPGTTVKLLGVIWLGERYIVPEAMIDKGQPLRM